jgi:hypothetical protein
MCDPNYDLMCAAWMKSRWIMPVMLQLVIALHAHGATPSPVWAVDPAVPGADLPRAGASLFDLITADAQGRRQIPFPFERLIARVESAAGCSEPDPCTRSVLIPLGRSLQRVAAFPDFFAHPRVVSAVVAAGRGPSLLRDRIYLGYQDRTDLIEVISYNETLARFEFQLVKNYRADSTPQVVYAPRTVCIACHQNHGPIFSRQVWLETNANPLIATRLEQQHVDFHGVAARTTTDAANAIDDATDRANRLALVQRLWRDGCGDQPSGARCRTLALIAALQYGLTGERAYDSRSSEFQRDVVETLGRNARSRWPAGIAVPNPDIPNRDPLAFTQSNASISLANVSAQFEPLLPRQPLEIVGPSARELSDQLVRGLAQFWSDADVEALDRAIGYRDSKAVAAERSIEIPCSVESSGDRLRFVCVNKPASSSHVAAADAAELAGTVMRTGGSLDTVSVGDAEPIRHLRVDAVNHAQGESHSVLMTVHDGKRTARLPDGAAIRLISLQWTGPVSDKRFQAVATMAIRDDFTHVADRVEVPAGPVRSVWMAQMTARLRGEAAVTSQAVAPTAQTDELASQPLVAATLPFEAECGSCHHTAQRSPPNFLTGSARRVNASLTSCAPRILVRMAMHDVPAAQRAKTPMPPESTVLPGEVVVDSPSHPLAAARKSIEELLQREYGHVPTLDELLQHGYENLRACIAPEATGDPAIVNE